MTDEERMETTGTGRGGNGATAAGSGGEDWEERARRAEAALEEALAERNRLWEELHQRAANENELDHYRRLAATMRPRRRGESRGPCAMPSAWRSRAAPAGARWPRRSAASCKRADERRRDRRDPRA